MSKREYSSRRIEAIRTIATASHYIAHIDDLPPGPVVLFLRVSTPGQERKGHLDHQESKLRQLKDRGFDIIGVFRETGAGWAAVRVRFETAAAISKDGGATLVAESSGRFIRTYRYGERVKEARQRRGERKTVHLLPNVAEYEALLALVDGAALATLHHPNMPEAEVRGEESKRGQAATGNRGGRPKGKMSKKQRRELNMPKVVELRKSGLSFRAIGEKLGIAWSTTWAWMMRNRTG